MIGIKKLCGWVEVDGCPHLKQDRICKLPNQRCDYIVYTFSNKQFKNKKRILEQFRKIYTENMELKKLLSKSKQK